MGKRFTDTTIWTKPWFRKLKPVEKSAWFYITASCDSVGVWDADYELGNFIIGEQVEWSELIEKCNGNIDVLENGKWFLVDFCSFQYGPLNPSCPPHRSYIALLEKHGLKGYRKGIHTLVLRVQEKEKELEKDKDKKEYAPSVCFTTAEYDKLVAEYGEKKTALAIYKLSAYKLEKGRHYKSDYGAILSWAMDAVGGVKVKESDKECPECHIRGGNHGAFCSHNKS